MRLLHGDCFDLMKEIPDGSVDMILTDPPYGCTKAKWDVKIDIPVFFQQAWRVLKPNGALVHFATFKAGIEWAAEGGKNFRYDLVWQKSKAMGYLCANDRPLRNHELILVYYQKSPEYHPQMTAGKPYKAKQPAVRTPLYDSRKDTVIVNNGSRYPVSIQKFGYDNHGSGHATVKPVALLSWLIRTFTSAGQLVLDPFMGTGSTGVACAMEGRRFIGIEKDEHYFEVAEKRVKEATCAL